MAPIALKGNTAIFCKYSSHPSPLRSKPRLENKEPAVILSKFRHLIQQNYEILDDNSKYLSVRSYNEIATQYTAASSERPWVLIEFKTVWNSRFKCFLRTFYKCTGNRSNIFHLQIRVCNNIIKKICDNCRMSVEYISRNVHVCVFICGNPAHQGTMVKIKFSL